MKILIKRIVGFFEFIVGVSVPAWAIASAFFEPKYIFKWQYLSLFPIYFSFIKYGWLWMFNLVEITDVKALKPKDDYYQIATKKALSDIETFLGYLRKEEFLCCVLIPSKLNKPNSKRNWFVANYLNNEELTVLFGKDTLTLPLSKIEDWFVEKDDMIIGNYTFKALADKIIASGQKLNRKSNIILQKIIT
jgi:hypothetical protein